MAENLILKKIYHVGKKLKEDNYGIIYDGLFIPARTRIHIREYHRKFCVPALIDAIQQEVLSVALLNHPDIVKMLDTVFTEEQRLFVIYNTPYEGSLADLLVKIEKFGPQETSNLLNTLGKALEYAHQKKIIHGAVTPENVLMMADGQIMLTNFAIDNLLNSIALNKNLLLLNPVYLTPEQLKNEPVRKTTDVYQLGILAYRLLTGHNPYPEISNISMIMANQRRSPESLILRNPQLPKYLEEIIFKAIELQPQYRHQTILEFLGDLHARKVTMQVEDLKQRFDAERKKRAPAPQTTEEEEINLIDIPPVKTDRQKKVSSYNMPQSQAAQTANNRTREVRSENRKMKNNFRNYISYAIIFIFLGIILAIFNSLYINYFTSIAKVEIPNVLGRPLPEAEQELTQVKLRAKVYGYINDARVTENCIVSTIPVAGRVVKQNRLVKLFVSKGEDQYTVPNLIESNFNQVKPAIEKDKIRLTVKQKKYSREYPPNVIISQDPLAGTKVSKNSEIAVVISDGFPVNLSLVDHSADTLIVKLSLGNLPDWEPQNAIVYLTDKSGRRKYFEKTIQPNETKTLEITTEVDAIIEVFYFNDLAYKQELKYLVQEQAPKND